MTIPTTVYRVSIHNQIFNSTYYVVTQWCAANRGGWKPAGRYGYRIGMRGKGNSLGMGFSEARELAALKNQQEGWKSDMTVNNSQGKVAFDLHA